MSIAALRGPLGQKAPPAVSAAVRARARNETCTLMLDCCVGGTETTVFCHVREPGDGLGIKPPDYWGLYACRAYHDALDGRNGLGWMCGDADVRRAIRITQDRLWEKGLLALNKRSDK